jgi:hypothetical protein
VAFLWAFNDDVLHDLAVQFLTLAEKHRSSLMPQRRFPPPWTVDETDACFSVKHNNGQMCAYTSRMNRGDKGPRSCSAAIRRGASWANIAKLPDLMRR